jgi:hypothetical protein
MGRILDKSQDMDDKNGLNMKQIIIIIAINMATIVVDYIDNI